MFKPSKDEITEVIFLKKECDTAVVKIGECNKRVKQQFIYGTLGQLTYGEKIFVEKKYLEDLYTPESFLK